MKSYQFLKIFLIRFTGYLFIFIGLLTIVLIIEPVISEEGKYRLDQIISKSYVLPQVITSGRFTPEESSPSSFATASVDRSSPPSEVSTQEIPNQAFEAVSPQAEPVRNDNGSSGSQVIKERSQHAGLSLGSLSLGQQNTIIPVSTDFGIVIEKINANAKVIANTNPVDEAAYTKALSEGVAHAQGSALPGEKGNIYLFAHSTNASWNIVRFNAVFFLLSKLDPGDRIILFYQGRRFDYQVFNKMVVEANDTQFLTDSYDSSILTLQTCYPPGTILKRLIVMAKL